MPGTFLHILRRMSCWLFLPAVALIVWAELRPSLNGLLAPSGFGDKVEHFIAYFGLAAMATLALGLGGRLALAIPGILLLGGALEILQHFAGRDTSMKTVIADTLGVVAGLTVAAVFVTLVEPMPEDYPSAD